MHCVSLTRYLLLYLIIAMAANRSVDHLAERFPALEAIDQLELLIDIPGLSWQLFTTPNCAPCQDIKRKLPLWAYDFLPSSRCFSIDLTVLPQACSAFQVLSAPTLIVCLDGQEIARQVRYVNFSLLREQLARPLALWQASLSATGG